MAARARVSFLSPGQKQAGQHVQAPHGGRHRFLQLLPRNTRALSPSSIGFRRSAKWRRYWTTRVVRYGQHSQLAHLSLVLTSRPSGKRACRARTARSRTWPQKGLRVDIAEVRVGVSHFNFPEVKDDGLGGTTKEWKPHECLSFPMYTVGGRVVRQKIRGIENKRHMRLHPTGGGWGLFGLNTIPADAKEVVLTEGEFDAMAVHQATGMPAVSLPSGAASLPPAVLPLLERFDKRIYGWTTTRSRANQRPCTQAWSRTNCMALDRLHQLDDSSDHTGEVKDANDALLRRLDMSRMLKSVPIFHEQILNLERMKDDVLLYLRDPAARRGSVHVIAWHERDFERPSSW